MTGVECLSPFLVEEGIAENPETLSAHELHERGWNIVRPYFEKVQKDALEQYRQLADTGKT